MAIARHSAHIQAIANARRTRTIRSHADTVDYTCYDLLGTSIFLLVLLRTVLCTTANDEKRDAAVPFHYSSMPSHTGHLEE
mmetsp:Transcript_24367/g.34923  ORF Transcript_24367/g.34923 Transcript_24367/m.34923 type:complete len:81 (-) Transcript_24367:549-791(-)